MIYVGNVGNMCTNDFFFPLFFSFVLDLTIVLLGGGEKKKKKKRKTAGESFPKKKDSRGCALP